jgi:hypothetical protein
MCPNSALASTAQGKTLPGKKGYAEGERESPCRRTGHPDLRCGSRIFAETRARSVIHQARAEGRSTHPVAPSFNRPKGPIV